MINDNALMKSALLVALVCTVCAMGGCRRPQDQASTKPSLVLVAFGTSVPEARKVFEYIDAAAKKRYPEMNIRWAFTSEFIRKKLKATGVETQSVEEVIADLRDSGVTQAVFQSLHVVPGQEFHEIGQANAAGIKVAVGKALMTTDADIAAVLDALSPEIKPDAANIVAAHGNDHHPEFNQQIIAFAQAIQAGKKNVFVCTVEGQPGTGGLQAARKLAAKTGKANFIPLMIVAGDHIQNDVLGDEKDSWKSLVDAKEATCAKPLGYNDAILAIYFRHIDEAMKELDE
jgi:sirohydrochlorin cobaltochelatase